MNVALRYLFFLIIVRPICLVMLGFNIRRGELLPKRGPAIIVSNHNSHLDAIAIMTLFPLRRLKHVRPVAAADYFMNGGWFQWFVLNIIGIIPLDRNVRQSRGDPLAAVGEAVQRGDIVILFPEGGRGEPEELAAFKSGVAHLARRYPDVPVVPIFIHGLGRALPRGEALLVPFFIDLYLGSPIFFHGGKDDFMNELNAAIAALRDECFAVQRQ